MYLHPHIDMRVKIVIYVGETDDVEMNSADMADVDADLAMPWSRQMLTRGHYR